MADRFKEWDRFQRHYTLTQDSSKALGWSRYERWKEEREAKELKHKAVELANASVAKAIGRALESDTSDWREKAIALRRPSSQK